MHMSWGWGFLTSPRALARKAAVGVQKRTITWEGGVRVPRDDRPEYLRIADELRARISEGAYRPGDKLPTLPELRDAYGASEIDHPQRPDRPAQRRPHRIAHSRRHHGPRATAHSPHGRRLVPARPRRAAVHALYQGPGHIGWSEYRLDKRFEKRRADAELAALFECEVGEPLLARHFVFYDNDQPTRMSTSYVRWSDVGGHGGCGPDQ
jgi:GntR family transcriptional regulator